MIIKTSKIILVVIILLLAGCSEKQAEDEKAITVTVSVYGANEEYILENELIEVEKNVSVADALSAVCVKNETDLEIRGNGSDSYIVSIDKVREFSEGSGSRWVFVINNEYSLKKPGSVRLNGGENIRFYFTLNLGKDIQEKFS